MFQPTEGASSGRKIRLFDVTVQCENDISRHRPHCLLLSTSVNDLAHETLLGKVSILIPPLVQNKYFCIINRLCNSRIVMASSYLLCYGQSILIP